MAVIHSPESSAGKELWRWDHTTAERNPVDPSIRGMRPVSHQPYPKALYRVIERNPLTFEMQTAADEDAVARLTPRGFVVGGQKAAVEAYDAQQREFAALAANRAYQERRMSPAAQAEAAAYDAETDGHVPAIPELPRPKRGRPKKREGDA